MTVVSAHQCHIGQKRAQNEDYVWVDEQAGIFIVADGMGGHDAGDIASQLAATTTGPNLVEHLKSESRSTAELRELFVRTIETANTTVYDTASSSGHTRKMGTTIVVALVRPPVAYISHVGDSRAYLARGATLTQLTEDDSWDVEFGNQAQAQNSGRRHKFGHFLTKAVGQPSPVNPSFKELEISAGDCLLLCSDGLWSVVDDDQILAEIRKAEATPPQVVDALVAAANAVGGDDNISVVAIQVRSGPA
jgi:protein phosphatase